MLKISMMRLMLNILLFDLLAFFLFDVGVVVFLSPCFDGDLVDKADAFAAFFSSLSLCV